MSYLSENITALMEQRGLNATTLAQATGVPQPTIHRILRGVSKDPRTDTVKPLADFFGVSVDALRTTYLGAVKRNAQDVSSGPDPADISAGQLFALRARNRAMELSMERDAEFQSALEELFDDMTPGHMEDPVDKASSYKFGYATEKIVAEFAVLPVRTQRWRPPSGSQTLRRLTLVDTTPAIRALWRLSCSRMATSLVEPKRTYLLFVDMVTVDDEANINTPRIALRLARLISEARLHGITVIACGPLEAAQRLLAAEKGEDFEMFDHPYDEWTSPEK